MKKNINKNNVVEKKQSNKTKGTKKTSKKIDVVQRKTIEKKMKSEQIEVTKKADNKMNGAHNKGKTPLYSVIYIFIGLFVLVAGYFTYFLVFRGEATVNNAYNKRHDILAERVMKGEILSADLETLAETLVDEEGVEYRNYPYGDMFVHIIGRDRKGRTGLEETENITLLTSSINTFGIMYNDLVGEKSAGDNVVTTLDSELQRIAYDALGNNRGAVVVMEPRTGKILAMVSKPAYDPNTIDSMWDLLAEDKSEESPFLNRATQGLYPPGSTFKLLTTLEYMRENADYMDYHYDCKGKIEYNGMVIRCYNSKAHGKEDLMRSFAKSCNSAYASIGKGIDITKFRTLSESFLFNTPLSIAMTSNPSRFELQLGSSGVKETMQTAIGQGKTLITPLHNGMIAAAVANGGTMMKPYLVDHIENAEGSIVKRYYPETYSTPMTTTEAAYLTGIMNEVVEKGTGSGLSGLKYRVAGKTGSADTEGKKAHAWFIGFAPVEDPRLVVSVIVENKGTGSEYAIPIAKQIFQAYFD